MPQPASGLVGGRCASACPLLAWQPEGGPGGDGVTPWCVLDHRSVDRWSMTGCGMHLGRLREDSLNLRHWCRRWWQPGGPDRRCRSVCLLKNATCRRLPMRKWPIVERNMPCDTIHEFNQSRLANVREPIRSTTTPGNMLRQYGSWVDQAVHVCEQSLPSDKQPTNCPLPQLDLFNNTFQSNMIKFWKHASRRDPAHRSQWFSIYNISTLPMKKGRPCAW